MTNVCIVATIVVYLAAMLAVGFAYSKSNEDSTDFYLGGRKMGPLVTAMSAEASDMSSWLLMGMPGLAYLTGIASPGWTAIGLAVGTWLNWLIVARRLRRYSANLDAITVPQFLSLRFHDQRNLLNALGAVIIIVFFIPYTASGFAACGKLFNSLFGVDYMAAMILSAVVIVGYTIMGGFRAVSTTDLIQSVVMSMALIAVLMYGVSVAGGWDVVLDNARSLPGYLTMAASHNAADNTATSYSLLDIASTLAWGLGYFGQPHILVRFMATRSIKVIPNARRVATLWMSFCLSGAVAVGFFGAAFFAEHRDVASLVEQNHERVFIVLSGLLFNPWIAGILMSAILAAVMSTLSCQLLVCSSTLTEDFYRTFIRRNASQRELVWFGRSMVLLVSVVAVWLARDPNSLVLSLVSYAWAGFGAAFGPVIIMSLWWRRMTRNGALAGMITGAVTVLVWNHYAWLGLYEILPGFVFALIAIVVVSLLDKAPSKSIAKTFDEVQAAVRNPA